MNKEFYINNIADLPFDEITGAIRKGIVTFSELQSTGDFNPQKQKHVKDILKKFEEEDTDFNTAITLSDLTNFKNKYPNSDYSDRIDMKISNIMSEQHQRRQREFQRIKDNINDYKPDEVRDKLGDEFLRELCNDLGVDYNVVVDFKEPELTFNDIPQSENDIPKGFTDVFFWGIPSSGKTTALSAIFRTMKDRYTILSPAIPKKFGATYRDSLTNIYENGTAYLPGRTNEDRTQYMPFLLKRRNEKENKYRKISFFELSGEVFKFFYEKENNVTILKPEDREKIEQSFSTIELLLRSDNQKIHFFLIDYNRETKGYRDRHNLTQEDYLNAAATYFRDNNNIFKRKTDAVYIVLTKSDEIKDENKVEYAKQFLSENFGNFMDIMKNRCKKDSVVFGVKIFSIGDVYFKSICKLNYKYSENIINELLDRVKPNEETFFGRFFRS